MMIPEDRPLTRELLDDYHCALCFRIDRNHDTGAVNALFLQRFDEHPPFIVVSNFADVRRPQSEPLRPDHRRRYLSARQLLMIAQTHLAVELGKKGNGDQVVHWVEAQTHEIELAIVRD